MLESLTVLPFLSQAEPIHLTNCMLHTDLLYDFIIGVGVKLIREHLRARHCFDLLALSLGKGRHHGQSRSEAPAARDCASRCSARQALCCDRGAGAARECEPARLPAPWRALAPHQVRAAAQPDLGRRNGTGQDAPGHCVRCCADQAPEWCSEHFATATTVWTGCDSVSKDSSTALLDRRTAERAAKLDGAVRALRSEYPRAHVRRTKDRAHSDREQSHCTCDWQGTSRESESLCAIGAF